MKKMAMVVNSVLLAVMLFSAGNSYATSLYVGSPYSGIQSLVNGVAVTEGGGSIDNSTLDGRQLAYLYCVDLFTKVYVNADYPYTSVNNAAIIHGNVVNNAGSVAYLLGNYGVGGQGDQAIALQAAIWHEVNDAGVYNLNTAAYGADSSIVELYNKFVAEAANNTGIVSNFLWINPGADAQGQVIYQGLVAAAPVPEPGTIVLFSAGILSLAIYGKRRKNNKV